MKNEVLGMKNLFVYFEYFILHFFISIFHILFEETM